MPPTNTISAFPNAVTFFKSLQSVSEAWNPGIDYADLTDVGMRRANNQDSLACLPAKTIERFRSRGHLFVVADGMGAHAAGELASRMATERISLHYYRSNSSSVSEALRESVDEANTEIHRRGQQNPEFHNMGTTASSLALTPEGAVVAHVGDSRVYRLRGASFEQLTFDHSLVWEMEASGQVLANSPLRHSIPKNVITRSLGPNAEVAIDVEGPFPVHVGDTFLLCSDGLTGQVEDHEIGAIVDCMPAALAVRVLVDLANLRGGPDNTTVIIVRIEDDQHFIAKIVRNEPRLHEKVSPVLLCLVALCFLMATAMAATAMLVTPADSGGWWGKMVVSLLCGVVSAGVAVYQHREFTRKNSRDSTSSFAGGNGPYRRYSAAATKELHQKMSGTVEALRQAATTKQWSLDWTKIDQLQKESLDALSQRQPKQAIRLEAEAIIETMRQLREENNRDDRDAEIDY